MYRTCILTFSMSNLIYSITELEIEFFCYVMRLNA